MELACGQRIRLGVFLTHQGDTIFLTWFTYDIDGRPLWFVGSNIVKTGNATYSGPLYHTNGPAFTAQPWDSSHVLVAPVGGVTIVFSDASHGTMTYSLPGVSGSKSITRQLFANPPTVCG